MMVDDPARGLAAELEGYLPTGTYTKLFTHAKNMHLISSDEEAYLDFTGNESLTPLGHHNGAVERAIAGNPSEFEGVAQTAYSTYPSMALYLRRLGTCYPGKQFMFTNTADDAMRVALGWRNPKGIVAGINRPFPRTLARERGIIVPYDPVVGDDQVRQLDALMAKDHSPTRLVISRVHPHTFDELDGRVMLRVAELREKMGDALTVIWDETVTAYWETTPGDVLRANPLADVTVLGGAVGGGMQLGCAVLTDGKIDRALQYKGSMHAFAAGATTFDEVLRLRRTEAAALQRVTARLDDEMAAVAQDAGNRGIVGRVLGRDRQRGIEFATPLLARDFALRCAQEGMLVGQPVGHKGRVVRVALPLTATVTDVVELANAMFTTLMDMRGARDSEAEEPKR